MAALLIVLAGGASVGHSAQREGSLCPRHFTRITGAVCTKGAVQDVDLRRGRDKRLALHRRLGLGARGFTAKLPRGLYRLVSATRPCDAYCDHLDPPEARCTAGIRIRVGRRITLALHDSPGRRCRIAAPDPRRPDT